MHQKPGCPARLLRSARLAQTLALWLLVGLAASSPASGQESAYPSRPIHIVVPYPPGGFNDTLARLVGTRLQQAWKQSVVIDNKPGSSTIVGSQAVATAPADGYTLLIGSFPFASNPWVYTNLPYDSQKAFAPVVLAGRSTLVLVTPINSPMRNVADVIAAAKAKPGTLNYGSAGIAASNHLAMALFENLAGVQMNHIPYKGGAPAMTDLAGGQLDLSFDLLPNALPFMQAGKLRALAVADRKRSPLLPEVPTVPEAGGPDYEVSGWHGFLVAAATPPDIVAKLNREINLILKMDDIRTTFIQQGVIPDGGTPAEFRAFIDRQLGLWKTVIQKNKIRVE